MELQLDLVEARVLGALIEKEISTPEYYPLTLNSLAAACNQKNNRDPVVEFDEKAVVRALDSLRLVQLARMVSGAEQRVPKYYHRAGETLGLERPALALICELLVRGPQSSGELRTRGNRMARIADVGEVEAALRNLSEHADGPFVIKLPRAPGTRDARYAHLLSGGVHVAPQPEEPQEPASPRPGLAERLGRLEAEVESLRLEVEELKRRGS